MTVALGTNNGGVYSGTNSYPAADRGTDWAGVIADLRSSAPAHVTVVGANDIEASFDDSAQSVAHADAWEDSYLEVDNTGGAVGNLIFNGSLDNCPDGFQPTATRARRVGN